MGNTKTYYIEGSLIRGVTLDKLKDAIHREFHSTYCVAEIVESEKGYLGVTDGEGPFVVAAIHSYSLAGDYGPDGIAPLFSEMWMHRVDRDWSDYWVGNWKDGKPEDRMRIDVGLGPATGAAAK